MSVAVVHSRAQVGVRAVPVEVEAHLANGLPSLSIVGLPETAVKESKDRVRSALITSHFDFPARRITVNLAPADLPKEGSRFDLPIAIGILAASGQIPIKALDRYEFVGELALTGLLRPVRGVLSAALASCDAGRALFVAQDNAAEGALVKGAALYAVEHLLEVTGHLSETARLEPLVGMASPTNSSRGDLDLDEVKGQYAAKRALTVAAAGGHSLLLMGPPGTGKTMLANRLPGLLPPLTDTEALETAAVMSLSHGGFAAGCWRRRPFRSPHHSASSVALVGGGSYPRPGEISLAHHGVLFLDELPEFPRRVLDHLREPMETGVIHISRAARQVKFPARFQLVAAMNPCPCGWLGDPSGRCACTSDQVQRYRGKLSGPLLDRIDIQVEVPPVNRSTLMRKQSCSESSRQVRERVCVARDRQLARAGVLNRDLTGRQLRESCILSEDAGGLLERAMDRLDLSARAHDRVLRISRTIADLVGSDQIRAQHIGEAVSYRSLDRAIPIR